LLVVGGLIGLLVLWAPEDYWDRMKTMAHFVDPEESAGAPVDWRRSEDINSANSRLNYWKAGWDMFTHHPVFGIGLCNFTSLIARYIPGEFHVTHNTYLQLLAETGLMGFLLFMAMLTLTYYNLSYAQKHAARCADSGRVYRFCEAARMGLLGFMICMFFISRQSYEPLYWLFTLSALCRGLVFCSGVRGRGSGIRVHSRESVPSRALNGGAAYR